MNVVLAFDSFKGSLSASTICRIAAASIKQHWPDAKVQRVPMADGGEGTLEAFMANDRGRIVTCTNVSGPLPGQTLTASYGWLPNERAALVEMAQASGLTAIPKGKRNPLVTTTRGTGELLADALRRGAKHLLLTLGGSATNDGGTGAAAALGWRFLDDHGHVVPDGGGSLARIARIVPPETDPLDVLVEILCDVDNPLCGPDGAAAVYGPQKGATPEMVRQLDHGLAHLAACVRQSLTLDIRHLPGAGAAGGFGGGAVAFLGGKLVPGSAAVARAVHLDEALADADWVITGEGCFDEQSLRGKVVSHVLRQARKHGVQTAVLAGRVTLSEDVRKHTGITVIAACAPPELPLDQALTQAPELARSACARIVRRMKTLGGGTPTKRVPAHRDESPVAPIPNSLRP